MNNTSAGQLVGALGGQHVQAGAVEVPIGSGVWWVQATGAQPGQPFAYTATQYAGFATTYGLTCIITSAIFE